MEISNKADLYHDKLVGMLEHVWGGGWLSPGGLGEIDRLLEGVSLAGKFVLDIGCGSGGVDVFLVEAHGAGYVTGADVEDTVLVAAR